MDKKNLILGIGCLVAAFAYQFYAGSKALKEARENPAPVVTAIEATEPSATPNADDITIPQAGSSSSVNNIDKVTEAIRSIEETVNQVDQTFHTLSNDFVEVVFTNWGGAIKEVRLKKYQKENTNEAKLADGSPNYYVINEGIENPGLSLQLDASGFSRATLPYTKTSLENNTITFERKADDLLIRRTYTVASEGDDQDPYEIIHKSEIINLSENPTIAGTAKLNVGTSRPVESDKMGQYLTAGYYDGQETNIWGRPKALFTSITAFTGSSGFLGIGASDPVESSPQQGPIVWSSVKNQFFTSVLTPSEPATSGSSTMYKLNELDDNGAAKAAITASVDFEIATLKASESKDIEIRYFVGPKEFRRLDMMGERQDLVMQFGFFGFFAKVLLGFMQFIQHYIASNWGVAIIIMTICIKLIFWPLTAKASKSQKRMHKIQQPLQEIRSKYKDNPKKLQQETVKLFKENGVNPAAGCLPILIQIPIFLGLFGMLRTASELRFADFLWITDLSQPDTVAVLPIFGGFPVNIMPIFMMITMVVQMRMMPTPTPPAGAGKEMAEMQQKMFKFMPFIFVIFLYNFSSGLVVYWTVQNLLTILQQYITNKKKDDEPLVIPAQTKKKGTKKSSTKKS